ncbi:MAG TPA: hypothetical protein VE422_02720 [Terriglobia bacterium]|nr:hypothetical protein [Terriglobia bacterium]
MRFRSLFVCLLVFVFNYSALAQGAPSAQDVPSQATLWLYRPASDYSGMDLTLHMDGRKLVGLSAGRFLGIRVPFGSHTFCWTNQSSARQVVVSIERVQQAYLEVSFRSNEPFLRISPRTPEEAIGQISVLQAVDSTRIFNSALIVPASNRPEAPPNVVEIELASEIGSAPTSNIPEPLPNVVEIELGSEAESTPAGVSTSENTPISSALPSSEPADVQQFEKVIQTAILPESPSGIEKSSEGWTGVFFVDGQRIEVTPETKVVFKLTSGESEFRPLDSLEEILPGMLMTYEGKRDMETGKIMADRVEFSRNDVEEGGQQ